MNGSEIQVGVRLTGDSTSLVEATTEAKASQQSLDDSVKGLGASWRDYEDTIKRQNAQMAQTTALMDMERDRAWALANGYKEVNGTLVKYAAEAEMAAAASGHAAGATAALSRELMVVAREGMAGRLSRIPGSLMLVSQYASGILGPLAMVGAALAAGGVLWDEYEKHASKSAKKVAEQEGASAQKVIEGLDQEISLLKARNDLAAQGLTGLTDDQAKRLETIHKTIAADKREIDIMRRDEINGSVQDLDAYAALQKDLAKSIELSNEITSKLGKASTLQADLKAKEDAVRHSQEAVKNLLKSAQQMDAEFVNSNKTAMQRSTDDFQALDAKLIALGARGYAARMKLEADYRTWHDAAEKKEAEKALAHHQRMLATEQEYFSRVSAERMQAGSSAKHQEDLRFQREMADWKKRYDLAKASHKDFLEEEAAYLKARDDLIKAHQDREIAQLGVVGEMTLAWEGHNHKEQFDATANYFIALTGLSASHNRTMFEANKAFKESKAIVDAISGANTLLADPGGPVGWAMAGAELVWGLANAASIQSTSFGGGAASAAAPPSLSLPSIPSTPSPTIPSSANSGAGVQGPTDPTRHFHLTLIGVNPNSKEPQFTYDQLVNQIFPLMDKAYGNGAGTLDVSYG